MSKLEENDLFIFIQSLRNSEYKSFKRYLQSLNKKDSVLKYKLFEAISKKRKLDKAKLIKKYALSDKKYSVLKFELFQELISFLKTNYDTYSDIALQNLVIEFELLLNSGLYIKANRRLKKIKEIALEKCDFNTCCVVQSKAINHRLYVQTNPPSNLAKESTKLRKYQELSDNLNTYRLLSDEVLNAHYEYMDKRVHDRETFLDYLNDPHLQDINMASSVMAKYYFYRIKSLVYFGDNNYEENKKYSLIAYNYLKSHPSKYRDDYVHYLICLNNYLDSSIRLLETEPFMEVYPKIIELVNSNTKNNSIDINTQTFQVLCSLKLNYFWLTKDVDSFLKEEQEFEEKYKKYEGTFRPNFKIEIILCLAKMYFISGSLKKANNYCKMINNEKTNPTSLFISCVTLLRIMINYDMENYRLIPHLISTSKYSLKKRSRLFNLELQFLNGLHKIKFYYSEDEKSKLFSELYVKIKTLLENSEEIIVDKEIRILEWLQEKIQ
ncbi:hypothetical protein [uncultured Lacinutrix sp.]|uniref:hypothetical protein n=1 Tax=uncultured Lacinutrix sp. TaxID=574032 RepID=UPI00263837B5|nr:hypothetical protein [uncultured Lacinutrix sp.]